LDWTIFQPSVMFGPGDSFLNRFAGLLAAIPWVFPLAKPNARFQPVFVDDVIEAIAPLPARRRRQPSKPTNSAVLRFYSLREIVGLVAKLTGRRRWIIGLPDPLARMQALIMDFVPGRPFSKRQLSLIDHRQRQQGGRLREARNQAAIHGGERPPSISALSKTTRASATTARAPAATKQSGISGWPGRQYSLNKSMSSMRESCE